MALIDWLVRSKLVLIMNIFQDPALLKFVSMANIIFERPCNGLDNQTLVYHHRTSGSVPSDFMMKLVVKKMILEHVGFRISSNYYSRLC
jgi:hypothetical protein